MSTFKRELISGTFYIGISKYAGILSQIVITAILARLLTPQDYGIITIAMIFIAFFNVLSDVGIGVAIIQRKDLTKTDFNHLFSITVYIGIVLAVIFFCMSKFISNIYDNSQLLYVCRLLSLLILFTCLKIVPMNLLYREKKFKYIAFTNFSVQILCGLAAIVTAYWGWGVYALVLSSILSSLLLCIIYSFKYHCHFNLKIDFSPIKKIYSYSIYNFAGAIFIFLIQNIDKLLVGKYIGTKQLGFYEKSFNLVFLPINNITFVITPVLHPLFSEFQNNLRELSNKYFKIVESLAYVSFPLSVFLYFASEEIILIFYGNQWITAIEPFKIMSISVSLLILDTTVGAIYNSANETKRGFFTMLIMSAIMIIAICAAIFGWGTIVSVAYAFLIARMITTLINFYSLTHGLEGKFADFISHIYKPASIALILFILTFIYNTYIYNDNLLISLIIKFIVWLGTSLLLIQWIGGYKILKIINEVVLRRENIHS